MQSVREDFVQLVRLGIGKPGRLSERPDWRGVLALGHKSSLLAVMWDGYSSIKDTLSPEQLPSEELTLKWFSTVVGSYESRYVEYSETVHSLARFFRDEAGIKMMVLKGYGLSLYYPQPHHRPCGDIDIWLFGRQREGDRLLTERRGIEVDYSHDHHTVCHVDGFMVEDHYDLINVHTHLSNAQAEPLFKRLAEDDSHSEDGEGLVYLPSPNFNALFLLKHASAHWAADKITLRHVLDWALFVQTESSHIDWPWLQTTARQYHLEVFLDILNSICIDYLGFDPELFPIFSKTPDQVGGDEGGQSSHPRHALASQLQRDNPRHARPDRASQLQRDASIGRVFNDIISPEFAEPMPRGCALRVLWWKLRRWHANIWKSRMIYPESLFVTFWVQVRSHFIKPESMRQIN